MFSLKARAPKSLHESAALSLTHFIDDLEEVLTDPGFPPNVERILFADGHEPDGCCSLRRLCDVGATSRSRFLSAA